MEANKPLRRSKRKRDLPTSSVAGVVETSKRSKRLQRETPLQESSPDRSGLRQNQPVDTGDSSVAPEFLDIGDNARDLQQMGHDGEGTSSNRDAEMEDVKDRVSAFPDLIQDKIFGFLNIRDKIQAAQVCSDWCHAAYKPCLWRHQKISIDLDRVTKEELFSLSEREISQIEVRGKNKSKMKVLLQTFPSLVSLQLESKVQTDIFLQKLSKSELPFLKDLSVMIERNREHVPSHLPQSLSRLSSLRTISIKGKVTNQLVQAIGRKLQELEELSLQMDSGNLDETDIGIRELNSLRCLQSLSLQRVALEDLSDFCQQNTRLKKLSLHNCRLPTADWAADLAKVTSLEELRLIRCSPAEGSLEPLQNLVNLKKLDLSPATNTDWLSVAKISSLEDIHMDLTKPVTDETVLAVCSNLTHLKALMVFGPCTVSPEIFVHFARLPSLQSLHISFVRTENFLETQIKGPCNLRSLLLRHVSVTSPFELKHLAQIPSLREVVLDSTKVSCSGLSSLRSLLLRHVSVTSPFELKHLAQIPSLREVVLDSTKVSCSGLSSLQQESFMLETLELIYCGVTLESVINGARQQTAFRERFRIGSDVVL